MTLSEYINQNPPRRMPKVELIQEEVQCGEWICRNPRLRCVLVKHYDYSYIQKEGDPTLWVHDDHGNPRDRSVFNVNS